MRRPKKEKGSSKVARAVTPLVFTLVGGIFFIVGMFFIYSGQQFTKASVEAELTVVLMDRKRSDDGFVYQPTFQSRSPDGQLVEYVPSIWVSPKPHTEGDVVEGRANWETGELRSVGMMKSSAFMGTIFSLMGSLCFVIGVGIAIWTRRKPTRI